MSGWIELRLRVAADASAALETLLEEAGALALTQGDGDIDVFAEPGVVNDDAWQSLELTALFAEDADVAAIEAAVRSLLGQGWPITRSIIPDQPWHEVWKQDWTPQHYAGGLCVCPTWCEPPPGAAHIIRLDPGGAFGTGTHETTALCLDWLGAANIDGARVIDYGCGSGILAIAAALLGATSVNAVDIDTDALQIARDNIELNGVGASVVVSLPEALAQGEADLLLANILLAPLITLAPRFAELLAPNGRLLLSGLLATQVPAALDAYSTRFTMAAPVLRGDWALLAGRRR